MIRTSSVRYVLAFLTAVGISAFLFHAIGGFPVVVALLIALILWAIADALDSI